MGDENIFLNGGWGGASASIDLKRSSFTEYGMVACNHSPKDRSAPPTPSPNTRLNALIRSESLRLQDSIGSQATLTRRYRAAFRLAR